MLSLHPSPATVKSRWPYSIPLKLKLNFMVLGLWNLSQKNFLPKLNFPPKPQALLPVLLKILVRFWYLWSANKLCGGWRGVEGKGFPGGSVGKESACNVGDSSSIHGSGRSPREEQGNPLHYSCLENFMDREAWWATVHGMTESQTRLSDFQFHSRFVQESEVNRYKTPHS